MSAKYTFLAWDTPVKDSSTKLALLQLANNADDNGFSYYSISKMAIACDMSDRTFMRKIQNLEKLGILRVERRSNRPSLYTLIGDEMGVTICHLQNSEVTDCHAEVTDCHAGGDRLSHVPNKTPNKEPNIVDLLTKISGYWNGIMTTQPSINLLQKNEINKKRVSAINRIIKDYPDYSDHEYWEGHFQQLATMQDFEWQRTNKQIGFDQATNLTKFARNLDLMKMGVTQ